MESLILKSWTITMISVRKLKEQYMCVFEKGGYEWVGEYCWLRERKELVHFLALKGKKGNLFCPKMSDEIMSVAKEELY